MLTHTLGFPRIGLNRELKSILESFWTGDADEPKLRQVASAIRTKNWQMQADGGIDLLPVGDFSLYDHVLDTAVMLDLVPSRYKPRGERTDLTVYFRMARGDGGCGGLAPMELSKWFDTNYHYIVPEITPDMQCCPDCSELLGQIREAAAIGVATKPVLLGPLTLLRLSKPVTEECDPLDLIDHIVGAYEQILGCLAGNTEWIQVDEPILVLDMTERERSVFSSVLSRLIRAASPSKILLATYFGQLGENASLACLPELGGLHIDLTSAPGQLEDILQRLPGGPMLSLGLVNGRNVWKVNMDAALAMVDKAARALGEDRVMLGTSCSLLHVPVDLDQDTQLDPEIRSYLAFAVQKCQELRTIADIAMGTNRHAALDENRRVWRCRGAHNRLHDQGVRERCDTISEKMLHRSSPLDTRRSKQQTVLRLPLLPTTTIGSFPQTQDIRRARSEHKLGRISASQYEQLMHDSIRECVDNQHRLGLDVLVHGEPERNDMVEYFAEQMEGFCLTEEGWVQSYGSRCVKPPVIFGDVSRQKPMTTKWTLFAQSLTNKPMKGILTGPVTMLRWSFVREDIPQREICKQLALAIRDEVQDLEALGIRVIQVDEPALREGLPLRRGDKDAYLVWATEAFRLATSGVKDETQIHTHMCYSDFNDIVDWIIKMDADVVSMEASRSNMELLEAFRDLDYPSEIGPGVWDIHSPRVPYAEEMAGLILRALEVFPPERLWINPDCGLKTRGWCETLASLENMVAATAAIRKELGPKHRDGQQP